jgi:hypothetical protein
MADSTTQLRATLKKTAADFIANCNKHTVEAVLSQRTETCKHVQLPSSLGIPTYEKKGYGAFYAQFADMMGGCEASIVGGEEAMIVDIEKRKVVMHVTVKGDTPLGFYENEYFFILAMDETGEMIEDVVEFCDSALANKLMERAKGQSGV